MTIRRRIITLWSPAKSGHRARRCRGQSIEATKPRGTRPARERGAGAWIGGGDQGRWPPRGKMRQVRRAEPYQNTGGSDSGDLHVQGMRSGAEDDVTASRDATPTTAWSRATGFRNSILLEDYSLARSTSPSSSTAGATS